MKFLYTKIKRTPQLSSLDREKIMEQFSEEMLQHADAKGALEEIMRKGVDLSDGQRIKGTRDLSRMLENIRNEMLNKYNIKDFLKNLREELSKVAKESGMESLSKQIMEEKSLSKVIEEMEKHIPEDKLHPHTERKENYDRIEEFKRRYPFLFNRGEIPEYEELIEFIEKFQRINEMIESLKKAEMEKIDTSLIEETLGKELADYLDSLKAIKEFIEETAIKKDKNGKLILTPRAIRKIGEKAIRDIFTALKDARSGEHLMKRRGLWEVRYEEKKKYEGEDITHFDVVGTVFESFKRRMIKGGPTLTYDDFILYESDRSVKTSTALLLDMSWSMSWNNKFVAAKKVACALHHLIKTKFPKDTLYIIGFFTIAVEMKPEELPYADLNAAEPFTNIQHALQLSHQKLSADPNPNKQIILITDGQPTAYCADGVLHIEWPVFGVSPNALRATMKEVKVITKKGIKINTFMLDDNPYIVKFVEDITRINGGRAFFTTPEELGKYLLVDYIERKKKKIH